MNYDRPFSKPVTDWSLIAGVLVVVAAAIAAVAAVGLLRTVALKDGRVELTAVVVGYEEHGYPDKTNDWLRVSLPMKGGGTMNALVNAPRTFREFTPGETIPILYGKWLLEGGRFTEDFAIADARFVWTGRILFAGISWLALAGCLLWWRRERTKARRPAEPAEPSGAGRVAALGKSLGIYVGVWFAVATCFVAYVQYAPNHGAFTQTAVEFVARLAGMAFGAGLVVLIGLKLRLGIFAKPRRKNPIVTR